MKILKLINDEQKCARKRSKKACVRDICIAENSDYAQCAVNATDICKIDQALCFGTAKDFCENEIDLVACGPVANDPEYIV